MKYMQLEHFDIQSFLQLKEYERLNSSIHLKQLKSGESFGSCASDHSMNNSQI